MLNTAGSTAETASACAVGSPKEVACERVFWVVILLGDAMVNQGRVDVIGMRGQCRWSRATPRAALQYEALRWRSGSLAPGVFFAS